METHSRSLAKAVSWRICGLMTTVLLAWVLTSSIEFAATIGFFDTFIKTFAYYFHERMWVRLKFGRKVPKYPDYQI
jgi:uncharacterized membrane protein